VKIVSADDEATLERVSAVYGSVVTAGLHKAPSIKVAEAAKVIENIQRDINIALMNELVLIFDRLNISTSDVLAAAGTKWNFLPFTPGLVGGHCIGVDPYYLTSKAEQVGYHSQVILAGRRINDGMGKYFANKCVKLLIEAGKSVRHSKVGILGFTFKENVSDTRNTKVASIVAELKEYSITPVLHDPYANAAEVKAEYGIEMSSSLEELSDLDAMILAVPHKQYLDDVDKNIFSKLSDGAVLLDVKAALANSKLPENVHYWSI
jgi:UDP-N-acetyl-D-galactosamine dehydrogenase